MKIEDLDWQAHPLYGYGDQNTTNLVKRTLQGESIAYRAVLDLGNRKYSIVTGDIFSCPVHIQYEIMKVEGPSHYLDEPEKWSREKLEKFLAQIE